MVPTKQNFKIYQGSTFTHTVRWEDSTPVYAAITAITKAAPVVITAVAHGMPAGWRFSVNNVVGMKEINQSDDEYYYASSVTSDTVTINQLNGAGFTSYSSGGILQYYAPVSLANKIARLQVRASITSADTILDLTTENFAIELNDANKTITITIPASTTAALTFNSAVYSLEVEDTSTGVVDTLLTGTITLVKEITR